MITSNEIDNKIQEFRKEYVNATISRRQTILLQVRALKLAKERLEGKNTRWVK